MDLSWRWRVSVWASLKIGGSSEYYISLSDRVYFQKVSYFAERKREDILDLSSLCCIRAVFNGND